MAEKKKETKEVKAATKAPAKKQTEVKEEKVKKTQPVKEEPKKEEKVEPVTEDKKVVNNGKTYFLHKRKEDGKWALKYMGGEKVIKLFDTQKEALEYTKARAERNDRAVLVKNSKGAKKGKFRG